ncbi:MAG: DNA-3-methyladenine glycosylase [Vicinamibacterales bacterium]
MILPRAFYDRPTLEVARELVGKVLVHRTRGVITSGRIVEVEAYIGESDPACHAAPGRTRRNAPLYGEPGFAYVYLNYGIHHLVNAVTEPVDSPAAVLIRALEPLDGMSAMRRRRSAPTKGRRRASGVSIPDEDLCKGPGNLTQAMGIHLIHCGLDLCESPLFVEDAGGPPPSLLWGPRVGIRVGTDRAWRAWIAGHPSVSAPRQNAQGQPQISLNP